MSCEANERYRDFLAADNVGYPLRWILAVLWSGPDRVVDAHGNGAGPSGLFQPLSFPEALDGFIHLVKVLVEITFFFPDCCAA